MVKFAPDDPDYLSIRHFIFETAEVVPTPDAQVSYNDTGPSMFQRLASISLTDRKLLQRPMTHVTSTTPGL